VPLWYEMHPDACTAPASLSRQRSHDSSSREQLVIVTLAYGCEPVKLSKAGPGSRNSRHACSHLRWVACKQAAMRLSEEKQDQICGQFLEMMRRLDAHFASQVCSPLQASAQVLKRPEAQHCAAHALAVASNRLCLALPREQSGHDAPCSCLPMVSSWCCANCRRRCRSCSARRCGPYRAGPTARTW